MGHYWAIVGYRRIATLYGRSLPNPSCNSSGFPRYRKQTYCHTVLFSIAVLRGSFIILDKISASLPHAHNNSSDSRYIARVLPPNDTLGGDIGNLFEFSEVIVPNIPIVTSDKIIFKCPTRCIPIPIDNLGWFGLGDV